MIFYFFSNKQGNKILFSVVLQQNHSIKILVSVCRPSWFEILKYEVANQIQHVTNSAFSVIGMCCIGVKITIWWHTLIIYMTSSLKSEANCNKNNCWSRKCVFLTVNAHLKGFLFILALNTTIPMSLSYGEEVSQRHELKRRKHEMRCKRSDWTLES